MKMQRAKAICIAMVSLLLLSATPLGFARPQESIAIQVAEAMSSPSTFSWEKVISFVSSHQNPDGGFSEQWIWEDCLALEALESLGNVSAVDLDKTADWLKMHPLTYGGSSSTHDGIRSLEILNNLSSVNITAIANEVAHWQWLDGSFGDNIGDTDNCLKTLQILNALGSIDSQAATNWLISQQNTSDWGFGKDWQNMEETSRAVDALTTLNATDRVYVRYTAEWILSCEKAEGGFSYRPEYGKDIRSTFEAVKALGYLDALDRANTTAIVNWLLDRQHRDGGFGEPYSVFTWFEETCYTIMTLRLLNSLDSINRAKALDYLLQFYDSVEGAFRTESRTYQTYCAVVTLSAADALGRLDRENATRYLKRCQTADGGFTSYKAWGSGVEDTYYALRALEILGGLDKIDVPDVVNYLVFCQHKDGGFGNNHADQSWLKGTFLALSSLEILGKLDEIDKDSAAAWVASCQREDNGFSNRPEETGTSCAQTYYAIGSMSILNATNMINTTGASDFLVRHRNGEGSFDGNIEQTCDSVAALILLGRYDLLDYTTKGFALGLQNQDGGNGWWTRDPWSWLDSTMFAVSTITLLKPKTIIVPDNFSSIQEAINKAFPEDTIIVKSGTFNENIVVNKALTITGEDPESTTIKGTSTGNTVTIRSNNVNFSNFTVLANESKSPNCDLFLDNVSNCQVHENVLTNNYYGMLLRNSHNNVVSTNSITGNYVGIRLESHSFANELTNNIIKQNGNDGIQTDQSDDNHIEENNITWNNYNGINIYRSTNTRISNNTVVGNSVAGIYLTTNSSGSYVSNNNVTDNQYGIRALGSSDFSTVSFNAIQNNYEGIEISGSKGLTLRSNLLDDNRYGLRIYGSKVDDFVHDVDNSNLVNGRIVYLINGQDGLSVKPSTFPSAGYVALVNCSHARVENLTLEKNYDGLMLAYVNESEVANNHFADNYNGISMYYSPNNTITGNEIEHNRGNGIYMYYSPENTVSNNTLWRNGYGAYILYSTNSTVTANTFTRNGYGIYPYNSSTTVSNNVLESNNIGLYSSQCSNITMTANKVTDSRDVGVQLVNTRNSILTDNLIENNYYGLILDNSNGNTIYHNSFIDNDNQVWLHNSTFNVWDDGEKGNYWSDYTGTDTNGDGVGDTDIPWLNVDPKPLMNPPSWNVATKIIIDQPSPDINNDGTVNMMDLEVVARAFGTQPGIQAWDTKCDMNRDGQVNLWDIGFVAACVRK